MRPKRKKAPWNQTIADAKRQSKKAHYEWKIAGSPRPDHPLSQTRKYRNRKLRQAQRQMRWRVRKQNYERLMQANEEDSDLFHAIIKSQRSSQQCNTVELRLDNHLYTNDLTVAWDKHFGRLATPSQDENFTENRQQIARMNVKIISEMTKEATLPIEITKKEVLEAVNSLKKNKAADTFGLTAEHLRTAPEILTEYLTPVINTIFATGQIPEGLKEGLLHPIHKKGKPPEDPGNYRGITITPIITKVIDKLILDHQRIATPGRIHPLQCGFVEGRSGAHAAFLLTEAIAEAKDGGYTLYAASLDVQKAFDTVQHDSLLDKLHAQGLRGIWWNLKKNSYEGLSSRVVWGGKRSSNSIPILQGNGQGKLTSPDDYITYLQHLMSTITDSGIGFYLGETCISVPTCADDMIALAKSPEELQSIINMIEEYANDEHYKIHPIKSEIIPFNMRNKEDVENLKSGNPFSLNNKPLPIKQEMVHLGIKRDINSSKLTIADRISTARKTLYALTGSGLHGTNGLSVPTSLRLYEVYVMPRALYGLESITLSKSSIHDLEMFHRKTLRCILGLPERTATSALYVISGRIPIERTIHIKILTFLLSLLRNELTNNVVTRQFIMKDKKSSSWVIMAQELLSKYELPSIADLASDPPPKLPWKKRVKEKITEVAIKEIEEEVATKQTLRFLTPYMTPKHPHECVSYIENHRQVTRANIKLRILLGVYPLATVRARMKQATSGTCTICKNNEDEDPIHFLTECNVYEDIRRSYLPRILNLVPKKIQTSILADNTSLTQFMLDPDHPDIITTGLTLHADFRPNLEKVTRDYMFSLHIRRGGLVRC